MRIRLLDNHNSSVDHLEMVYLFEKTTDSLDAAYIFDVMFDVVFCYLKYFAILLCETCFK